MNYSMTEQEQEAMSLLVQFWNKYLELPGTVEATSTKV